MQKPNSSLSTKTLSTPNKNTINLKNSKNSTKTFESTINQEKEKERQWEQETRS